MIRRVYKRILKFERSVKQTSDTFNNYDKVYRMERYPNLPLLKVCAGFVGITLVGSIASYWIFQNRVHTHLAVNGAKIAKDIAESDDVKKGLQKILEEPELLITAGRLSAQVVQTILDDPTIKTKVLTLLGDIVADPIIQNLLVTLAVNFISREEIQNKLSDVIVDLLGRQEVKDKLNRLIDEACTNPENRVIVADMLKDILSKKETSDGLHSLAYSFFFGTGTEKEKSKDDNTSQ